MSQSIQAAQEQSIYSYDASNASDYAGLKAETPVTTDFTLYDSKAVWAFGLVVALVLAQIFRQRQKLPVGVKKLPKLPGKPSLSPPCAAVG